MFFNLTPLNKQETLKQYIENEMSKSREDIHTLVLCEIQHINSKNNCTGKDKKEKIYIETSGMIAGITHSIISDNYAAFKIADSKINGKLKILKRYVINKNGKINVVDCKTKNIELLDSNKVRTNGKYRIYSLTE